jgi:hypothetical protein
MYAFFSEINRWWSFEMFRLMNKEIFIVLVILVFSMVQCLQHVWIWVHFFRYYWLELWLLRFDIPLFDVKDKILLGKIWISIKYYKKTNIFHLRKETLILDYPLQQEKLVPCLATAYAFFHSFKKLENFRREILDNETILFELLPEVIIFNQLI